MGYVLSAGSTSIRPERGTISKLRNRSELDNMSGVELAYDGANVAGRVR
jgi:hypothetical protein